MIPITYLSLPPRGRATIRSGLIFMVASMYKIPGVLKVHVTMAFNVHKNPWTY
jgi:hypothetical protein